MNFVGASLLAICIEQKHRQQAGSYGGCGVAGASLAA